MGDVLERFDTQEEKTMIYSIPYISLLLMYAALAAYYQEADETWKRKINALCIVVFIFFFAFRGFVGDDWSNYYPAFQDVSGANISDFFYSIDDSRFEPGYIVLMLLCKSIFDSYHFLVFVIAIINCALLFRFIIQNINNPPLAIVLFLCMGGLILEINLLRNSVSLLLFVNSLKYIQERKPIKFFLLNLLGMTFHVSSILYFPMYFFMHKRCSKWVYLAILILGNVIFLLNIHFVTPLLTFFAGQLGEMYEQLVELYTEGKYGDMELKLSIGYIERVLTGGLIFCYYDKLVEIRKENVMHINAFIIFYSLFFLFSEFAVAGGRLANLFTFCYWILWIDLFKCFTILNNQKLYLAYLSTYCFLKIIGTTSIETFSYDNLLFGSKSYEERLYIYERYKLGQEEP